MIRTGRFRASAALALAFALAGCGGTEDEPAARPPASGAETARPAAAAPSPRAASDAHMALVPAGEYVVGSDKGFSHESPAHRVRLSAFRIDRREVTNARFRAFVEATGFVSEAERWGWSLGYNKAVSPTDEAHQHVQGVEWWIKIEGAQWRHPEGPESSIEGRDDHPVVQVSWNDAVAFCEWEGKRLPTEAEWEVAARGGLPGAEYPWGDEFNPDGRWMANTWQGHFPLENDGADGFPELAPVGSFPPNGYGLFDMGGNVWEWVADRYEARYYDRVPLENPRGPDAGDERVMRGGSWMCSPNYCLGYRVSHRNKATPDSGLNNTGFRCALDAE